MHDKGIAAIRTAVDLALDVQRHDRSPNHGPDATLFDGSASDPDVFDRVLAIALEGEEKYEKGEMTAAAFLAWVGYHATTIVHGAACKLAGLGSATCLRAHETEVLNALIQPFAIALLNSELDQPLDALDLRAVFRANKIPEDKRLAALAARIETNLRPRAEFRVLKDIRAESPIMQINAPITHQNSTTYGEVRATALRIASEALPEGWDCEVTSDYVSPNHPVAGREYQVRAALLRTSVHVIFVRGGAVGTGRTLEIATEFMIPTIILVHVPPGEGREALALRYSGALSGATVATYKNDDEAVAAVQEFVHSHEGQILDRSRRLAKWDTKTPSRWARRFANADASLFDHASLNAEQARFWVDPVHWAQAPRQVRKVVRRALGGRRSASPAPGRGQSGETPSRFSKTSPGLSFKTASSLLTYGLVNGLSTKRLGALLNAYRSEVRETAHSGREEEISMAIEDWARIDRTYPETER
jgi:hypothetical protein